MDTGKLVVTAEGKEDLPIQIGERLTIGRSAVNELVLDDPKASRNHAEIRHLGGGRYRLSDIGSANGTWINGKRVTVPRDLEDGDQIMIGSCLLRYLAPPVTHKRQEPASSGTALFMRDETVIVLVADIRNFTTMSEALPTREFSRFVAEWFREASELIENNDGCVDKFIGDAVMAYWVSSAQPASPAGEVNAALRTARALIGRAAVFSDRLAAAFPGNTFKIGVGLNLGKAMLGNVGTGDNQSFTIVGDSVNVAFRLEALTKERGVPVIISGSVAEAANSDFRFRPLGLAEVKGRKEPVQICALEL